MLSMATTPSLDCADTPWHSVTSSGATTPFTEAETLVDDRDSIGDSLGFRNTSFGSDVVTAQDTAAGSGVEWRCGRPGLELLISAVDESKNAAIARSGLPSSHDPTFERRAYLDGLSYLLRGLPQDLDDAEATRLRRALPSSVAGTRMDASGQVVYSSQTRQGLEKPSVLHKTTRLVVARIIVWFCILWPYILLLLRWMAAFERKHRISDRVVAQCTGMATALGRWTVGISDLIRARGDGRVGQALTETVAWTVHDMVAGLSDGMQDGLSQVGRRAWT